MRGDSVRRGVGREGCTARLAPTFGARAGAPVAPTGLWATSSPRAAPLGCDLSALRAFIQRVDPCSRSRGGESAVAHCRGPGLWWEWPVGWGNPLAGVLAPPCSKGRPPDGPDPAGGRSTQRPRHPHRAHVLARKAEPPASRPLDRERVSPPRGCDADSLVMGHCYLRGSDPVRPRWLARSSLQNGTDI